MNYDASGPTGEVFGAEIIRIGWRNLFYRRNEDGITQQLTEELTSTNKNARSKLEHVWQIGPVASGELVVLTDKYDWKCPNRSHIQGFVKWTTVGCTISEEAKANPACFLHFLL